MVFLQKNEKINYHPAQAYKFSLKHNALEKTFAYVQLLLNNKPGVGNIEDDVI